MSGTPRPPLVTCIGEILVDFLPIVEGGRTVGFRMHPGGSLLNVAMTVVRLGGRAALVSRTGADFFGRLLRRHVEDEGIDARWLDEAPAASTIGFVAFEDGEPGYTFYGDGAADTLLTEGDLPDALFDETAILHVGSISLLRGSTPDAVVAACERARGRSLVSFDPNLRPGLVRDEAAYRARLDRVAALADVVKVSAADLDWIAPGRDVEAAARDILAAGPALVAVTRGAAGVLAVRRTPSGVTTSELPAFPVTVVDTVGAGDSFDGGLLVRLTDLGATSRPALEALPDAALADAIRFGAAAGALDCTRPGADPPRRAEVEELLAGAAAAQRR